MARLHVNGDPDDPAFIMHSQLIHQMNAHVRLWMVADGLSDAQRKQAIASALLALTANFFRNYWGVSKEEFLQLAEEEYDMRGDESTTIADYRQ